MMVLVALATVVAVATPIKIWNSARIEHRLQEQEKLLLEAKIEALKSQINPHFLFNTLTSISSLIRSQPDTARMLIIKLSGLLRRLLRSHQHFVTLREELESIDEYLDIEVVRFGAEARRAQGHRPGHAGRHRAEHDPAAARRELHQARARAQARPRHDHDPQPARERRARSSRSKTTAWGSCSDRLDQPMSSGIGLANVRERLRVIYGATYQLKLTQRARARHAAPASRFPSCTQPEQITA